MTLKDAITANEIAIRFGGLPGIKREADILSAIGRPYVGYHRRIHQKAAALFQSLARNHGFNDGNKRTAVLLTVLLIEESGYRLTEVHDKELGDFALHVVNDNPPLDEIAEWFRQRISPQ